MKLLGIMVLTLITVATAVAQEPPQKLTLRTALEIANRQNLDLIAARTKKAVVAAGVLASEQRPNPTLFFGALRDTPHESLFMDLPLELGPKRSRRIELARQEATLAELDISALEQQVRRSVREAFYNLALARAITHRREDAMKLTQRLRDIAKARFNAGDVAQLEVNQTELEVARADADFQVAQQEEKVALSELNALLSEPARTNWDLSGALEMLPARQSLEELVARAAGSNPALQRILQERKVEKTHQSLLEAQRIPNLGLEFGADFNAPPSFHEGGRGQISMELPIFSRYRGEIAQSTATQRMLDSEAAAARRSVAGHVESAYFELDAREAEVELYRRTLLPATEQLESLAEESYRAGKSNILTVLDAQRNVQQVRRDYLQGLLAAQTAFAKLEETVGAPLD